MLVVFFALKVRDPKAPDSERRHLVLENYIHHF